MLPICIWELKFMRQRYWPLSKRNVCKKIVHSCVICFKTKPTSQQPPMGQFSNAKVNPSKPFSKTGLNFCGSVYVCQSFNRKSSKVKTYIAVFICMTIKAIYLELISDLSTFLTNPIILFTVIIQYIFC